MALSAVLVKNARPGPRHYALSDGGGLYLRVYPSGARCFSYRYKVGTRAHWISLGEFPATSLAEARAKADELAARRKSGGDPALDVAKAKRERRAKIVEAQFAKTFGDLTEEYFKRDVLPRYKRPEVARRVIDHDILPPLADFPIEEVQRKHLAAAIDKVLDRGANTHAKHVLDIIKRICAFGVSRGYLEHSPAAAIERRKIGGKETPRQRDLNLEEIRALWQVLDITEPRPLVAWQVRAAIKWLLLTGQRIGETMMTEWQHLDLQARLWRIPAGNTKAGRQHVVHISDALAELIEWIRPYSGGGRWVFAGERSSGNHFGEDSTSLVLRGLFTAGHLGFERCRPHDLRRTFASRISDAPLSVQMHVVEKILNHRMQGVLERYNKAEYLPERQAAMQAWGRHITALVSGGESNVVPFVRSA